MTTKEHLSKHDREIAAIRKLILLGMKLVNLNQQQINRLTQDQRRTEANLNRLSAEIRELTNRPHPTWKWERPHETQG
jgi:hypothetical protein